MRSRASVSSETGVVLLITVLAAGCGAAAGDEPDTVADRDSQPATSGASTYVSAVANDNAVAVAEGTSTSDESALDAPSDADSAPVPLTVAPDRADAPSVRLGAADTDWAFHMDDQFLAAPVIVVGRVDRPSKFLAVADPAGERFRAINDQSVSVLEVLKDDLGEVEEGQRLRVLMVGANLDNETVREAAQAGNAFIADSGLGSLMPGRYVLFLTPSGKSFDPEIDFSGTFTLTFSYQSALPVLDGNGVLGVPAPMLQRPSGAPELTAEAIGSLREKYELRPTFEIPADLTELRTSLERATRTHNIWSRVR